MSTVAEADPRAAIRELASRELRNFVDGEWREATSGESFDVLDPATGERLTTYVCSSPADVDAAMKSVRAAQPAWEQTAAAERAEALYALADLIREHAEELAALDALDEADWDIFTQRPRPSKARLARAAVKAVLA